MVFGCIVAFSSFIFFLRSWFCLVDGKEKVGLYFFVSLGLVCLVVSLSEGGWGQF